MAHCAVCHNTVKLYSCECGKKIYCSEICQIFDFERHAITCSISGVSPSQLQRFTPAEQVWIEQFEYLTDKYGPTLKFVFSLKKESERVDRLLLCLSEWMKGLVKFTKKPEFIITLEKIPTTSSLRTILLAPFLNNDPNFLTLATRLSKLQFPREFIELFRYPLTQRALFDMTLYWKWYKVKANYVSAPLEKWSIIQGASNEMLPFLNWGQQKMKKPIAIPVIRYQFNKTRGLYYNPGNQAYGGTFFYFEPSSPAFLVTMDSVVAAPNKIYALNVLNVPLDQVLKIGREKGLENTLNGGFGASTRFEIVTRTFHEEFGYVINTFEELIRLFYEIPAITYPTKECLAAWWAVEDAFDQFLWNSCINAGVSILILTRMAGYTRLISEVLATDARERLFRDMYIVE